MVAWHDGIDYTVEIAFGETPLSDPTGWTWTDVSAYVRDVPSIFRGRTSEYDEFAPATARLVLSNNDRRFDPDHASSPYYPDVVPMVPVRITATFDSTDRRRFNGFVLGWPQIEVGKGADGYVDLACVDGSRFMQNYALAGSAYGAAVLLDAPDHYWPMQATGRVDDLAGSLTFTAGAAGLTQSPTAFSGDYPLGEPAGLWHISYAGEPAALPRTIECWCYYPGGDLREEKDIAAFMTNGSNAEGITLRLWGRVGAVDPEVVVYFSDPDNSRYLLSTDTGHFMQPGLHHVVFACDATTARLYVDSVEVFSQSLSAGTLGGTSTGNVQMLGYDVSGADNESWISHVALYPDALTAAEVHDHYVAGTNAYGHPLNERGGARIGRVLDEIGWDSGRRNIDAGGTRQGPYLPAGRTAIEYIRDVERSEQGMFFFDVDGDARFIDRNQLALASSSVTFSDDGNAGDPVYTDLVRDGNHVDTIRNIITTSWVRADGAGGAITVRNATSRNAYGDAREFVDGPTIGHASTADNLGRYRLRLSKFPQQRISRLEVPWRVSSGDNEIDKLLGLDIGQIVTVERTPVGVGSQVSADFVVQGIEDQVSLDQGYLILYLSPRPPAADDVPYFQVGDATYGRVGDAYGNTIPF